MNGWTDVPADLSDADMVARVRAHLPREAPVVSSDLSRAIATADAILGERPRLPHQRGLREIHFGAWEGRSFAEIEGEEPDQLRRYLEDPGDVAPPGGESWNTLARRVTASVDALTGDSGDIIAVSHFGPILTQVQRARGSSNHDALNQEIAYLSVTCLRRDRDGWHVEAVNHIP